MKPQACNNQRQLVEFPGLPQCPGEFFCLSSFYLPPSRVLYFEWMKTSDFDYHLPESRIAQTPAEPRDSSRLMVLWRSGGRMEHRRFSDIGNYLSEGDVMVFNDSRVLPARLAGTRTGTGGKVEILLLRRTDDSRWEALVGRGKRLREGERILLQGNSTAELLENRKDGTWLVEFSDESALDDIGNVPLPPYIHQPLSEPQRYQTVYARLKGSAAAPTAGLHFTENLLERVAGMGVHCAFVTLHIGLDTFSPVREEDPATHVIHREYGILGPESAAAISAAKREGRRVVCVGTTTVRLLEQAALTNDPCHIEPFSDWVSLFILPGHKFRAADAMITNFHLPRSTLLMLVSAFAGKQLIDNAYREAIDEGYRFYSFGDAMLIL